MQRPAKQLKKDKKKQKELFLKKKILEVKKTGTYKINYFGLQKIPSKIYNCWNLIILDFGFNNIQTISTEINQLQNLERLYLNNNPVQYVPVELTECKKLSFIDLSNTYVKILPREMIHLRNLYYLKLSNCPLHPKLQEIYETGLPNLLEYFQNKMDHANWRAKIIQKLKEWHFTGDSFDRIQEMMEGVMNMLKDVSTNDLKRLNKNAERIFPKFIEEVDPEDIRKKLFTFHATQEESQDELEEIPQQYEEEEAGENEKENEEDQIQEQPEQEVTVEEQQPVVEEEQQEKPKQKGKKSKKSPKKGKK